MMIVQIYEIQTPEEAEKCLSLGVDHLGSVILSFEKWRLPSLREVISLSRNSKAKTSLIPLFQQEEVIFRALDYYRPDFVHLCESLTDENGRKGNLEGFASRQGRIREKFPEIKIMRSIPIPRNGSHGFPALEIAKRLEPVSDLFLTDTWLGREPVKGYIGITGRKADLGMARELVRQSQIPVILAGGLSPENVFEALLEVRPAGADSCTQTNASDADGVPIRFKKDFRKVETFVKEARRAERVVASKRKALEKKLKALKTELMERKASLPAHSVRPHQIIAIEALEEEIQTKEKEIEGLKGL